MSVDVNNIIILTNNSTYHHVSGATTARMLETISCSIHQVRRVRHEVNPPVILWCISVPGPIRH